MKALIQIFLAFFFMLYYFLTLTNGLNISNSIGVTVALFIPIAYIQSIFFPVKKYLSQGNIYLKDLLKFSLFLYIAVSYMQDINKATSTVYYVETIRVDLKDSWFVMLYYCLGVFALDLGSILASIRLKKQRHSETRIESIRPIIPLLLLIISSVFMFILLWTGVSGYGTDLIYTHGIFSLINNSVGIINTFALTVSAYVVFRKKEISKNYKVIFIALVLSQIGIGLISGMKEEAITPVVIVAIIYILSGFKVKTKYLLIGITAVIFLYPITNSYRDILNDPFYEKSSKIEMLNLSIISMLNDTSNNTSHEGIFDQSLESYSSRLSQYPYFHSAIENQESWNYYANMERYLYLPVYPLIPRFLWVEKPRADEGAYYNNMLTGRMTNSVTVTSLGWAYLEGGLVYMLIIFTFIGFILKRIDILRDKNVFFLLIYIHIFLLVIKPEWDPFFAFSGSLQAALVYYILLKATKFKLRNKIYS